MSYSSLLINTCTIYRPAAKSAGSSGHLTSMPRSLVAAGVKCSIQEQSGSRPVNEIGTEEKVSAKGFFKKTQDIQEGDQVVEGGRTFLVIWVNNAAGRFHHKEVGLNLDMRGN